MKAMLATPQARKEFYDFCSDYLGEDITGIIDIQGRENLELVGAALLIKQTLMEEYPVTYGQLKKEIALNE